MRNRRKTKKGLNEKHTYGAYAIFDDKVENIPDISILNIFSSLYNKKQFN